MDYNTQNEKLRFREYGRNVQSMVQYAMKLEDREKRNDTAKAIIEIMGHLNPSIKVNEGYKQTLWDHLYEISEYKLDVDAPYPMPDPEVLQQEKRPLPPYPKGRVKVRNYGDNVMNLIAKTLKMPEKEKRDAMAEVIGNYMKLIHRNWNRDNVNDEVVRLDLKKLSEGELVLSEDANLNKLASTTRKPSPKGGRDNNRRNNNQNRGRNSNNNNNSRGKRRKY